MVGLAILKPAKLSTQTSLWMAKHTTESSLVTKLVHIYKGTSLGYLDSVVCCTIHTHVCVLFAGLSIANPTNETFSMFLFLVPCVGLQSS